MKIYYICDRQACEKCNPKCKFTQDIKHAEKFAEYRTDNHEAGYIELGNEDFDRLCERADK